MSISSDFFSRLQISSIFNNILKPKNQEHATNFTGTSIQLNGPNTSVYLPPRTLVDYIGIYCYPLSFIGAILFSLIQIIDINVNSIIVNKNLTTLVSVFFIIWSILAISTYYNLSLNIPYIGELFSINIPYILPFNPQSVILQY